MDYESVFGKISSISDGNINQLTLKKFTFIICFLLDNKERMATRESFSSIDDSQTILNLLKKFTKNKNQLSIPNTIPDEAVNEILKCSYLKKYKNKERKVKEVIDAHRKAMSAENILGHLLEQYIATKAEPAGWIWCRGDIVKSVDFIKPPCNSEINDWKMLQIKNRSNSENSSSSAIRDRTQIKKWYRVNAHSGNTNWENFPDEELSQELSEDDFINFLRGYFCQNKQNKT